MSKLKTMKKSMFVSTVLMVVLLIVALSTATFAWFSANNTVTATQTKMTAATSSDANITIGWAQNPTGSKISFDPVTGMKPAIPLTKPGSNGEVIPAQYVATNNPTATSALGINVVPYAKVEGAGAHEAATSIKVVDITLTETVTIDTAENLLPRLPKTTPASTIEGNIVPFARMYQTKAFEDLKYVAIAGTLNPSEIQKITYDGIEYDNLLISDVVGENNITSATAQAAPYNIPTADALNGYKIFHKLATGAVYTVFVQGAVPPNFVASGITMTNGGVSGNNAITSKDYVTFMTVEKILDTMVNANFFVNLDVVQKANGGFKCVNAEVGDTILCAREAVTLAKATTATEFEASLNHASIDTANRFRENGASAGYKLLQESGAGTGTGFYIKNTGVTGSAAAVITLKANIEGVGDATNMEGIRIAVFATTGGTDNVFTYRGTMATSAADTCYGAIIKGASALKDDLGKYTASASLEKFISISAGVNVQMSFLVWYEGTLLTTEQSAMAVNVDFEFSAGV